MINAGTQKIWQKTSPTIPQTIEAMARPLFLGGA